MSALDFKKMLERERNALREERKTKQNEALVLSEETTDNDSAKTIKELSILPISNWLGIKTIREVGLIPTMYYAAEVISYDTEQLLLQHVDESILVQPWKQLRGRKLQCWGNFPEVHGAELSTEMPQWLSVLITNLVDLKIFDQSTYPDNILINRYESNEGILHHTDGPAYYEKVAILSLGSDCMMSFRKKLKSEEIGKEYSGDVCTVLLKRRSLFVFEKDAYSCYMHGIDSEQSVAGVVEDRKVCINNDCLVAAEEEAPQVCRLYIYYTILYYTMNELI